MQSVVNAECNVCCAAGITILLSLSVFQLIVADMVPATSLAVPLVGKRTQLVVEIVSNEYRNCQVRSVIVNLRSCKASGPDYGIGTVGKCLGPTTSKGSTEDGCKIF